MDNQGVEIILAMSVFLRISLAPPFPEIIKDENDDAKAGEFGSCCTRYSVPGTVPGYT